MESREHLEDHHAMALALEQARMCLDLGEVPVGCVIVRKGELIAAAGNRRETAQDPTAHAEILAIRRAAESLGSWRLEECELFVTLEPCAMCAGAMILARVKRCVYGAHDPKGGFLGTVGDLSAVAALNHHIEVQGGVDAESSAELLRGFFRELRGRQRVSGT